MIKVLFICHGNICRSPMCEFIMKDLVRSRGLEGEYHIESAATSSEELGNPVYPPARAKLAEHGISCKGKTARRVRSDEYDDWDLFIGMDSENMHNLLRLFRNDPKNKVHKLLEYTGRARDVSDPWYTRDFEATWNDALSGCNALLDELESQPPLFFASKYDIIRNS